MTSSDQMPIFLFSGLAANQDVFAPQMRAFSKLVVPPWPTPRPLETLDSYAERIATQIRELLIASEDEVVLVGGASFGGIVAMHVAKYLPTQGIVLIGSVCSPSELPRMLRSARFLRGLVRFLPVAMFQRLMTLLTIRPVRRRFPHLAGLAMQFVGCDPVVFKWSVARLLDWNEAPDVNCPVHRIHGERDWVLPQRNTDAEVTVLGGGHVISLTHPKEVNRFLESVLNACRN